MSKDKNLYVDRLQNCIDCTCISLDRWNELMKGSVKANGAKIRAMIKKQMPELYYSLALNFYNPYEYKSRRTDTHYIYVHSGIEYFFTRTIKPL